MWDGETPEEYEERQRAVMSYEEQMRERERRERQRARPKAVPMRMELTQFTEDEWWEFTYQRVDAMLARWEKERASGE